MEMLGEGASTGREITVDNELVTYVTDGAQLKIQAVIKKEVADARCEFVGVYYTTQGENGNSVTKFLKLDQTWIKSTNSDGAVVHTHYLDNITSDKLYSKKPRFS